METSPRKQGDSLRRNYTDEEVFDIYSLGKLWLDTGQHKRAESLMSGLNEVAPGFAPAWLGTAYLKLTAGDYDDALRAAKSALRINPESAEAMLYIVALSLTLGDASTAGTYLGEVGESIEQDKVSNQHVARLFKMQLARYQNRGK